MKRRTPAICAEERCASPTIKRTKVQAQRKFAQGCNNYAYSSAKITSKPADACSFSSLQTSQTATVSENDDCELNNFSSLPTVDDFLTFLCFRETEVLPERLNYLNTPRYNGLPAKKKPAKTVVTEEHTDKRNDDEFENTSCKSKSPLKKKKISEYKLRSCNVKTKNIVGKPSRSLALKHNQRLRTKSVVKAKYSENKLQIHKDKDPSVKKSVPHPMKPTKFVNKNLRNRSSTTPVCDKEEFTKPDTTSVRFKRVTRRNSVLELKPDISKNPIPYKKLVGSKSKCNTTKKVPVPVENTRCCMKKPSAKSLRVSLPKFKPDVTNAILNKTSSKRVTRSTRSSSVQKETPPAQIPSSRPSRRTKEAATLYMEMLGRDMLCPDERSEDDDSVSVDSFPELPNTEEHIRREKELKEIHQKNNTEKSLCRKSNITNTKSLTKSSGIKPPNKDAQKNSVQEKQLPVEGTKDEELVTANGISTRSKHYTTEANVSAACKDISVKISRTRVRNDRGLKFGRRNSYADIFDKSKRTNSIFSKELNRIKVDKKSDIDNKMNKSDNAVKKLFDEKLSERKSKKNSKFKSKFISQLNKCKKKHIDLRLPLRRSSEPVTIEKQTRKIIADDKNKVKSSDSEIDDETEPLLKILQKIKDKKAQLRDMEKSGNTFEGFNAHVHPIMEKISRRKDVLPKTMKRTVITANDGKELPWAKKSIEQLVLEDNEEGVQVESVVEGKSDVSEGKEYLKLTEVKSKELTSLDIKSNESKKSVQDQLESKSTEISQCPLKNYEDESKTSKSNLLKPMKAGGGSFKELKGQAEVKRNETSITMGVKPKNRQKNVEVKSRGLINTTKIESKELLNVVKVGCKENIKVAGVKSKEQSSAYGKPAKVLSSVEDKSKEFPMNVEANCESTSKVTEVKLKQTNAVKVECKEKIKVAEVKYKESSAGNKLEELLLPAEDVPKEVTVTVGTNSKESCKDAEIYSKQINLLNVKCKEKMKTAVVKSKESSTDLKPEELLYSFADLSNKLIMKVETDCKETGKVAELLCISTNVVKVKCKEKIKSAQIKSREPFSISDNSEELLLSSAENKSEELTMITKTDHEETVEVAEPKSKLTNSVKVKCKEMIKIPGVKYKNLSFMDAKSEEQLSSVEDKSKEAETNSKKKGKVTEVKSKSCIKNMDLKIKNIANAVKINFNDMSETIEEHSKVPVKAFKVKSEGTEKFKELKEQANCVEVQFNEPSKTIKDVSALPVKALRMKSEDVEKLEEVKCKEPKFVEVQIEDQVNRNELKSNKLTKSVLEKLIIPPVTSKVKPNEEAKLVEEKLALSTQAMLVKSKGVAKCLDEKFKNLPPVVGLMAQEADRIVDTKSKEQTRTVEMKFREPGKPVENKSKALMKTAEVELKKVAKIVEVIPKKLPRPAELKINEPINSTELDTKKEINTTEIKSNLSTRAMTAKYTNAVRCVDQQSKELINPLKENSNELTSFKEEKSKEPATIENIKYKEVTKKEPTKSLIVKPKEASGVAVEEVKEWIHSEEELKSTSITTTMEMKAKEILKNSKKESKNITSVITVNSEIPKTLETKSKESTKSIEKISEELKKMIDTKAETMTKTEELQLKPSELRMTTKVKAEQSEKIKELKSTKLVNTIEVKSKEFTDLKTEESIKLVDMKSNPTKLLEMKFNEPTNGVQVKSKESTKPADINTEDLSKSLGLSFKEPSKILSEKPQERTNVLEINAAESSETAALESKELTTSEYPHSYGSSKVSAAIAKKFPTNPVTESTKSMKILDSELYKPFKIVEMRSNKTVKTKEQRYAVKPKEVIEQSSDTAEVKVRVLATTERVHSHESSKMAAAEVKTFTAIRTAGFTKSVNMSDYEYCRHPKPAEMTSVKDAEAKELATAVVKSVEPTTKIVNVTSSKSVPTVQPANASNIHVPNAKEMASEGAQKPVSTIENLCKSADVLFTNDNEIPRNNATDRKISNKSSRSSEAEKADTRLGMDNNATRVEMKLSETRLPKKPLTSSQSTDSIFSSKNTEDGFSNVAATRECKLSKETAKEPEGLTSVLSQSKVTSNDVRKKIAKSCDTSPREDKQLAVTSSKTFNFKKPAQQRSFFSNLKTTKDDKTVIQTVVSSNSKAFNLESKKITFKKNTTSSSSSTEASEEPNPRKSEAFSPDNENSVYAFEPDLPATSTPFRRWKPVTPPKSIAVQVNLESDSQVECSSTSDAHVSSTTDCSNDRVFYIPIQTSTTTSTLGVAVKLDTDGTNQKIIMSATLITNSPTLTTISNPTNVTSRTATVETSYVQMDNVKFSSNEHTPKKAASSLETEEVAAKIDKSADTPSIQVACSSTSSASSSSSSPPPPLPPSPKTQKKPNSQSVKIVKLNKNKNLRAKIESTRSKQRPTKNKNAKKPAEDPASSNSETIPSAAAGEILEAPTFYPTAEEFNDPLEYIDTIRPVAEKFGLCRIVPPSNFRPECKVADEMRFTAYNQYVHKMLHRWGPNVKEMMAIKKFLTTQNITFTHPPWIGGMEVDLPRLYQIVQQCGGLKDVIEKERWQQVADIMKIPKLAQDRIAKLDDIYCKYLLPYDVLSHGEREELFEDIEKEWKAHLEDPTDDEIFDDIDECIVKGRTMPLSCFYRIARNTMLMCFGNLEGQEGPTTEKIEEEFWNHVSKRKSHICVHSGSIDSGTHGYGFSVAKNSTFRKNPWNLKVLTNNSASILRSLGPIMGVTVPTLHVGMLYSACCWYRDPHCLPWIEYLHTGANKIWYGIPDEHSEKLKEAMLLLVPRYCRDKKIWLPSDTVMIPPPLLTSQNISMSRVVQHPGQFIVVFPKSFTSSISTGYLVSESVYFAHADWLDSAKQIFTDMQDSCEPSVFSLEQLLICVAEDARASLQILTKVLPLLVDLRDTEVALRNQLKELGLNDFEKLNINKKRKSKTTFNEEDIYECETCRTNLFVSLVISSHEQSNYCLRHAATRLYKKPTLGKHYKLMYVYTEEELETLIEKVKSRIEAKSSKKPHGK